MRCLVTVLHVTNEKGKCKFKHGVTDCSSVTVSNILQEFTQDGAITHYPLIRHLNSQMSLSSQNLVLVVLYLVCQV